MATSINVFSPWSTPNSRFGVNGTMTDVGAEVKAYNVSTSTYNIDLYYQGIENASPSKPKNLRVTNTSVGPVTLVWNANTEPNIASYLVLSDDLDMFPPNGTPGWIYLGTTTSTNFTDYQYTWQPSSGDRLEYKIEAKNSLGELSVYSDIAPAYGNPSYAAGRSPKPPNLGKSTTVAEPTAFSLAQNYPNPFNPSTEISFAIPKDSYVKLVVYDMLGREVAKLADGEMSAGYHAVTWNASGVASGVYIYRFSAGNFVQVKRMLLLK